MPKLWVAGSVLVFSLLGCGLVSIGEGTLKAVQNGNETQGGILENTEQMAQGMAELQRLTEQLKKQMETMAKGVHLQILTVALGALLDPQNTVNLSPPTRMIPYAKAFAEEATAEELVQATHLLLQETKLAPGDEHAKTVTLTAVMALSAFAPDVSMASILTDQIENHGRYEETTYSIAMGRYQFIRDYLFDPIISNAKILNLGTLNEALRNFAQLKFLATKPYSASFSLSVASLGLEVTFDPTDLSDLGARAQRRFSQKLPQDVLAQPSVLALLSQFTS